MKEWDLDAYQRKYYNTLTVFKRDGELVSGFVKGVSPAPVKKNGEYVFAIYDGNDNSLLSGDPIYYRFEGKLYNSSKGVVGISRKIIKSFKVGLAEETHNILSLERSHPIHPLYVNPFTPVKVDVEKALKVGGPISDRLYITKSEVFFVTQEVGLRKGSKFMVNNSVWQEVKDCLQGYQCSISK